MPSVVTQLAALEGVASAMAASRDGIDALLRDRGLRRTPPDLTTESLLRGAVASAQLAGSRSTDEDVRAGRLDEMASSAVRVTTDLLALVPVMRHSPQRVVTRLHILAAKGQVPAEELGRPRPGVDTERLAGWARMLVDRSSVSALVLAAVAHAELRAIAPFGVYDGVIARAVERLVLVSRGVDPTSLTVPEAGHLAYAKPYESALAGYVSDGQRGAHAWLLYAADAYAAGAEASPLSGTPPRS